MRTTILSDRDIRAALLWTPPLVEGLRETETQIQPCGVDLTVRFVSRFVGPGAVDFDNSRRALAPRENMEWVDGAMTLTPGAYHIVYNEIVNLPNTIMALAYPRSSLLRCGVMVYTAVWDPGYSGRGEALMVVQNAGGFLLYEAARVVQLVFAALGNPAFDGYGGRFHGENLDA